MPAASTPELTGYLSRRRPLVRLLFSNCTHDRQDRLLLVDTGCTFDLVVGDRDLATELGLKPTNTIEQGLLASGRSQNFQIYQTTISWLGRERRISVHVPLPSVKPAFMSFDEEPIGMIGTGLLLMTKLMIDFAARTVRICESEIPSGA